MSAQLSLLPRTPQAPRQRASRPPATADAEAMARRRPVSVYPLSGAVYAGCWANRPSATPVEAIDAGLTRIGLAAGCLEARAGVNPDEIELRLKGEAEGLLPHHLLAVIVGLTLDEARTALTRLVKE